MEKIDSLIDELLAICCQKCLALYNVLLDASYEYDDLFSLSGIESGDEKIQKKLDELLPISMQLEDCSVVIEDESYDDKLEQADILRNIHIKLAELEISIKQ